MMTKDSAMRYEDYNSMVIDRSGTVCYICDLENNELLHLTKAGMELYGVSCAEEYKNRKCYEFLQGLTQPCPFCTSSRLKEGEEYRWEHYNERLGRWFDVTDSLLQINGRMCRMEVIRDITARKEAAAAVSGNLSMEDVLFRCLDIFTKERDISAAVHLFLKSVGGYYQSDRAYLYEIDWNTNTMSATFEWCMEGVVPQIANTQELDLSLIGNWVDEFENGEEIYIDSVRNELSDTSLLYQRLMVQSVQRLILTPLRNDGKLVGFLGVDNPRDKIGHLALLRTVAEFVLAQLEKRRLTTELKSMSYVDVLTGIKNRNQFASDLNKYDRNPPNTLGVVSVDINNLKGINNTHGHEYGDYMIKEIANVMQAAFPGEVYRVSGDEFVALCVDIEKDRFQDKIIELRKTFDRRHDCDVSVGCAWSFGSTDIKMSYRRADERRQAEKQSYYQNLPDIKRSKLRTDGLGNEVLQEIKKGRFIVYYQPQVDIKTGKIMGAEALVRKIDDNGQLIPPSKFISFYEVGGAIGYVDLFVLRNACRAVRHWREQGLSLRISVNFSRMTLMQPGIVEAVKGICIEEGVSPVSITIEVTESVSKIEHEQLKTLIEELKAAGFSISLDDFGSEYSNLAILSTMQFDEVKFDRSLVSTLEENKSSRVVMESSVNMCRNLAGTSSLAEGIETRGQLELLLDYQCDYGQGYYFSKPVSLERFDQFIQRQGDEGNEGRKD